MSRDDARAPASAGALRLLRAVVECVDRAGRVEKLPEDREDRVAGDHRGDDERRDHRDRKKRSLTSRSLARELFLHDAVRDASDLDGGTGDEENARRDPSSDREPDEDPPIGGGHMSKFAPLVVGAHEKSPRTGADTAP